MTVAPLVQAQQYETASFDSGYDPFLHHIIRHKLRKRKNRKKLRRSISLDPRKRLRLLGIGRKRERKRRTTPIKIRQSSVRLIRRTPIRNIARSPYRKPVRKHRLISKPKMERPLQKPIIQPIKRPQVQRPSIPTMQPISKWEVAIPEQEYENKEFEHPEIYEDGRYDDEENDEGLYEYPSYDDEGHGDSMEDQYQVEEITPEHTAIEKPVNKTRSILVGLVLVGVGIGIARRIMNKK